MTRVVFVGEMYNADLSVGGGPVYPPVGGGSPPGIWGPTDPRPTHPIAGYPWPQPPPGGGGPVDPGYSPPWARPPVDPGYSPPWARPPVDPGWVGGIAPPNVIGGGPIYPSGPVDPGYSPGWARPPVDPGWSGGVAPPNVISGGPGSLPPYAMAPIYLPPQAPPIDPVDPSKMHLVAYIPNADGTQVERITFTVDKPVSEPPTEATPKA